MYGVPKNTIAHGLHGQLISYLLRITELSENTMSLKDKNQQQNYNDDRANGKIDSLSRTRLFS